METAFGEAIGLADNGFRIPGRLADAIASNASNLALDANAMATYFYPDGSPRKVGETMTNKAYARTLQSTRFTRGKRTTHWSNCASDCGKSRANRG